MSDFLNEEIVKRDIVNLRKELKNKKDSLNYCDVDMVNSTIYQICSIEQKLTYLNSILRNNRNEDNMKG